MLGPLSFLITEVTGAIKRSAAAYGLMALSGLIIVFAAGYGLDAVHSLLTRSQGPVGASLIVAAALVVLAGIVLAAAFVIRRRPQSKVADRASYAFHASVPRRATLRRLKAVTAALGGVVTASLAVFAFVRRRRSKAAVQRVRRPLFPTL